MRRDEYDFEAELAKSVSAIVNSELEKKKKAGMSDIYSDSDDSIIIENLDDEYVDYDKDDYDLEDLSNLGNTRNLGGYSRNSNNNNNSNSGNRRSDAKLATNGSSNGGKGSSRKGSSRQGNKQKKSNQPNTGSPNASHQTRGNNATSRQATNYWNTSGQDVAGRRTTGQSVARTTITGHTAERTTIAGQSVASRRMAEQTDNLQTKAAREKTDNVRRSGKSKKNSNIALIVGITVVILVVITVVFMLIYSAGQDAMKDTYAYQIDKAVTSYEQKDYENAVTYFANALGYYDEADQITIRHYLYECEKSLGNDEKAIEWLQDLLNYDNYNIKAISTIAGYYYDTNDSDSLNAMILKYTGTEAESAVSGFGNIMPGVSHCPGNYTTSIEVSLFNNTGNEIHYTLDGTIPNAKDPLYTEPITIGKGTTTLKAVTIDKNGIVSDVLECKYMVTYAVPGKPVVTPGSGTYDKEQFIEIENFVNDGSYTAYYTLDGTVPTNKSKVYTGPIDMPAGNNVFSVAFISKDGMTSTVVKRNYNLKLAARFTFDEALESLKIKLKSTGVLAESADALTTGESVKFVYYRKQTIDNMEMYLTYFDVRMGAGYVRQDYLYGIDVVTGKFYKVTDADGTLKADEYK